MPEPDGAGFGRPHFRMDELAAAERAKYEATWRDDRYRIVSPGLRHLADALEWMQPAPGTSFTDWGSGSGQAADAMVERGFRVRLVDIAANAYAGPNGPVVEACLWDLPADLPPTDYGFCADVMEHIPTERVDDVLAGIAARTRVACYFQIALFHDNCFTGNGPLHLSVFPPPWWHERIERHFASAEYRMVKRKHLLAIAKP